MSIDVPDREPRDESAAADESSIANSFATRSGRVCRRRGCCRARTIAAFEVRRVSVRGHEVGGRHEPVGVVMMLVDAEAVEADLPAKLQLVENSL